ncbi:PucR C-terminal helix-turn-helix domain (plasmid) [Rubrobacter radiotolerans]|uniref:PucR C-terminal helix-turn-helix domain n=1 Tax=Rubrobacter radiotolerans TaxID=42256 RepID=A0A023X7T9_RUBRA|nr:PucR C-terminal helix-turn-helix domain [Rubrobacter radiotolerans]
MLDPQSGRSLLTDTLPVPEHLASALKREVAGRSRPIPAVLRLATDPGPCAVLFVPASRPAVLVASPRTAEPPDLSVLRHVATVAALEVEKRVAEHERRRRLGAELLAGLVDGRLGADTASHLLREWNLVEEPRLLASLSGDGFTEKSSDLHFRLEDRGISHLLLKRAPLLTALLPGSPEAVEAFREEVDPSSPIGLSDPLGTPSRAPDAYRESQWALQEAKTTGKPVVRYGDDTFSPFLPRSLSESRRVVERVLGPILNYDASNGTGLLESLRTFLAYNRSWQKAAAELHVHRQTLVYRMRRVEELTGRKLDHIDDLTELWFALRAAEASGNLTPKANAPAQW